MSIIYITLAIVAVLVIALIYSGNVPKAYRHRKCMGRKWKEAFPDSPKAEIRNFLIIFAEAFCFNKENKLKFEPDDKIYDIYREVYPSNSVPDAMEVETFSLYLEQEYGFKLESIWSTDLSLGEVYGAIRNA